MKRSTCRTPICSRFSSMQYICFGRALPNLTTTICVPCIKCTTRRTSVCIHFSFLQYIRFCCSAFTTSTCHLAIRSLLALHACRTYSTWRTFRIPPLRCTCQILHNTCSLFFVRALQYDEKYPSRRLQNKSALHDYYAIHYFSMSNIL
jgi:hypothetical protein